MRRAIAGSLALLLGIAASPALAGGRIDPSPARLLAEIRALREDLRAAERETRDRRVNGNEVRRHLDRMRERIERLEHAVARMPPPMPPPMPMDDRAFLQLERTVRRMPFARDRLTVLASAASTNLFVTTQVEALLRQFPASDDRLEALRILWPRVVDPQNGWRLYDAFPFGRDRQRVAAILAGRTA